MGYKYRPIWKLAIVHVPCIVDKTDELEELLEDNYEPYAVSSPVQIAGEMYITHYLRKHDEVLIA